MVKKLIKKIIYKLFYRRSKFYLKQYLKFYERYHKRLISFFGKNIYDGLHPKNIFNFRHEFFMQHVTENDVVIDIGCGTGLILHKIASKIHKGYGIDISNENLKIRTKDSSHNIRFIEADLLKINYKKLKNELMYNTAILSHILEHIENVPLFLRNVNAEKLLICVPSQENWYTQLLINLGLPYFKDVGHFREYTRKMLKNELESAGYKADYTGFNSEGEIISKATKIP